MEQRWYLRDGSVPMTEIIQRDSNGNIIFHSNPFDPETDTEVTEGAYYEAIQLIQDSFDAAWADMLVLRESTVTSQQADLEALKTELEGLGITPLLLDSVLG